MRFYDVKKGMFLINYKIKGARPWYAAGKFAGHVLIRRNRKSKLYALAPSQLRSFKAVKL